jgi:hypothetical protein
MMSMNAWRSKVSASARRRSGLSKGGLSRLSSRLVLPPVVRNSQTAFGAWLLISRISAGVTL